MSIMEWFKALWPVVAILVGFGIRLEVGQALNRQRNRAIEKDVEREAEARKDNVTDLHSRISRHENSTGQTLREIQTDIKTLLQRQGN
ncbi:hypothetical protein [Pelagimonas phthalicica]|uniref:hypothetical protein n=1 Tax=Pelagimonas phthalicica TaxID=1037362 RepID=UPI00105E1220|nr:hypothetical protein [Pelagimonas phthalicica]